MITVASYLFVNLIIYLSLPLFLFPVPPRSSLSDKNEFKIRGKDGAISCYLIKNHSDKLILFMHGNGEDLSTLTDFLDQYSSYSGHSILTYDYPGYGQSEGKPSISSLVSSMDSVVTFALGSLGYMPQQLILHGRSLGTYPALKAASSYFPSGLILESGFSSLPEIIFPINPLLITGINNKRIAEEVITPTLVLHGSQDQVIPSWHAKILFRHLRSKYKAIHILKGLGHNNLYSSAPQAYFNFINDFLRQIDNYPIANF